MSCFFRCHRRQLRHKTTHAVKRTPAEVLNPKVFLNMNRGHTFSLIDNVRLSIKNRNNHGALMSQFFFVLYKLVIFTLRSVRYDLTHSKMISPIRRTLFLEFLRAREVKSRIRHDCTAPGGVLGHPEFRVNQNISKFLRIRDTNSCQQDRTRLFTDSNQSYKTFKSVS